jgi:hypothetical protein
MGKSIGIQNWVKNHPEEASLHSKEIATQNWQNPEYRQRNKTSSGYHHTKAFKSSASKLLTLRNINNWKDSAYRKKTVQMLRDTGAQRGAKISISLKYRNLSARELVMPIQPPAIREVDFLSINTVQMDSIKDCFDPFMRQLHMFLNRLPCLRDIQRFRRNWMKRTYNTAFGNFVIEPCHWYTYNHGGRNELQFNLGLCKDYFRIGLGFEFTRASRGDPRIVHDAYKSFLKVIQQDLDNFQQFVSRESLEVEYVIKRDAIIVNMENAVGWLLNPDKNAIWIFIGRLLMRNQDASILADSTALGNVIESVFKGFRPIWEKTQLLTKKSESP